MINERFLQKAEECKPELHHETVTVPGNGEPMKAGAEAVFDFGNHYVGYLSVDFGYEGHHPDAPLYFQIQFAEIKDELNQNPAEYHGWISKSWIQEEKIHFDEVPGICALPRRYAFRYVKIKILSVSDNYSVIINSLSADTVTSAKDDQLRYPVLPEEDRKLYEVSARTLRSCMQEVFEDGPKRDRRLWLGDLRLEAIANYETYRNYDLVKRCLYLFAGTTLEEGRLSNNLFLYPKPECDFQTMFDYTLFYINTQWDYYCAAKDLETLRELEPVCETQHRLLKEYFGKDGLLDMEKAGNVFIDWNFSLDKQASGQAVYIYAMNDLLKIQKELHKDTGELEDEIRRLSEASMKLFDEEKGLFVSGPNRQVSYMSQIWMILAGVVKDKDAREILERVEKTPDAVTMNSPYAYHHYIQALIDAGLKDKAYAKMKEYWGGMLKMGADTFWELYNPEDPGVSPYGGIIVHSFCHAWSCTPAYFLNKYFAD